MNELAQRINAWAKGKGFYDEDRNLGEMLALVHSEVSEALEDYRHGNMVTFFEGEKPCGFPSEIADTIIRLLDLCAYLGIDIEHEIDIKMQYNETRPYKHGKRC